MTSLDAYKYVPVNDKNDSDSPEIVNPLQPAFMQNGEVKCFVITEEFP